VHSTVDRLGVLTVAIFVIVVAAAGISGLVLLLAPGSTGRYFSWTLRPRAAAAVIGGLYVASAIVFAWALTASRRQARPLVVGILGLAVPTLVLTIVYDEVFDFSRWQAVLWVVLFVSAPVSAAAILATTAADDPGAARLHTWARALLGVVALALMTVAVLIWLDVTRSHVARVAPFDLVRLTGTYIGAWCSFLAAACAWAALRGTWDDARGPLIAIMLAAAGATLALLRSIGDIRYAAATLVVTLALGAVAVATYTLERPRAGA
jgi:hypothetical protein